jgi:hypothetical protein
LSQGAVNKTIAPMIAKSIGTHSHPAPIKSAAIDQRLPEIAIRYMIAILLRFPVWCNLR